jgi:hypothetical protein
MNILLFKLQQVVFQGDFETKQSMDILRLVF